MSHPVTKVLALVVAFGFCTFILIAPPLALSAAPNPPSPAMQDAIGRIERVEKTLDKLGNDHVLLRAEQIHIEEELKSIEQHASESDEHGPVVTRVAIASLRAEVQSMRSVGEEILKGMITLIGICLAAFMGWIWRTMKMAATFRAAEAKLTEFGGKADAAYHEANQVNRKLSKMNIEANRGKEE